MQSYRPNLLRTKDVLNLEAKSVCLSECEGTTSTRTWWDLCVDGRLLAKFEGRDRRRTREPCHARNWVLIRYWHAHRSSSCHGGVRSMGNDERRL
mmetsp:Transcript_8694/g.30959  ORF Transcript_8694/g.30959 Transcript_8694/m.30959 type:complete len:95 (+) Transcript_8694:43-327(+)